MEEDQTAQFISALAHLQPIDGDSLASLDGWSIDQLKQEVIRLRRALHHFHLNHPHPHNHVPPPPNMNPVPQVGVGVHPNMSPLSGVPQDMGLDRMGQHQDLIPHLPAYGYVHAMSPVMQHHTPPHSNSALDEQVRKRSFTEAMSPFTGGSATSRGKRPSRHDSGTGKRVERGRRVELQRAIRAKMRYMMGIGLEDDLPPPSEGDVASVGWVPSWTAGVGDARNSEVSVPCQAPAPVE